jgi:hypothetical protein
MFGQHDTASPSPGAVVFQKILFESRGARAVQSESLDIWRSVCRAVGPRRFPALPRATKKFEQMYKGRTAVERVTARLTIFWGGRRRQRDGVAAVRGPGGSGAGGACGVRDAVGLGAAA